MKVFQNLSIKGFNPQIVKSFEGYLQKGVEGWRSREDVTNRLAQLGTDTSIQRFCIESPSIKLKGKNIQSLLWIFCEGNQMEVSNIVPIIERNLSVEEYNYLLNLFHKQVLEAFADSLHLSIEISPSEDNVENYIGRDGLGKLQLFSDMANKSTGCTHPMDFKRWCEFLFSCMGKSYMSTDLLQDWLCSHGWSEDIAHELVLKYEYSIELLNRYENR